MIQINQLYESFGLQLHISFILTFFLQGYTHPREYIVTEWPLPNTCSDIWSLVYDHDCSAVVVLCNPTSTVSAVSINLTYEILPNNYFLHFLIHSKYNH